MMLQFTWHFHDEINGIWQTITNLLILIRTWWDTSNLHINSFELNSIYLVDLPSLYFSERVRHCFRRAWGLTSRVRSRIRSGVRSGIHYAVTTASTPASGWAGPLVSSFRFLRFLGAASLKGSAKKLHKCMTLIFIIIFDSIKLQ